MIRKHEMSKHLDNLERLCNKLQRRLGPQDALFQEAIHALEAYKTAEPAVPLRHDWSISYRSFIKGSRDEAVSQPVH